MKAGDLSLTPTNNEDNSIILTPLAPPVAMVIGQTSPIDFSIRRILSCSNSCSRTGSGLQLDHAGNALHPSNMEDVVTTSSDEYGQCHNIRSRSVSSVVSRSVSCVVSSVVSRSVSSVVGRLQNTSTADDRRTPQTRCVTSTEQMVIRPYNLSDQRHRQYVKLDHCSFPEVSTAGSGPEVGKLNHIQRVEEVSAAEAGERKKKTRTVFSRCQIVMLESTFTSRRYPSSIERCNIATQLNLTETQVKIWFQNRRNKWKRQFAVDANSYSSSSHRATSSDNEEHWVTTPRYQQHQPFGFSSCRLPLNQSLWYRLNCEVNSVPTSPLATLGSRYDYQQLSEPLD